MRTFLACLFLVLLQGCMALGPRFTPQAPPDADSALLYVYRPAEFTNSAITPELFVDNVKVAELTNGGYVVVTVRRGEHLIRLGLPGWRGEASSTGYAGAGDSVYFRTFTTYQVTYPTGTRTFSLRRRYVDDGLREIAETKKIAAVDLR